MSNIFDQIAENTPAYVKHYVDMSGDIADQIQAALSKQGLTQKDLAKALGKRESEISKWLSGTHNFTLKTLNKISAELGVELIEVKTHNYVQRPAQEASHEITQIHKNKKPTKKVGFKSDSK